MENPFLFRSPLSPVAGDLFCLQIRALKTNNPLRVFPIKHLKGTPGSHAIRAFLGKELPRNNHPSRCGLSAPLHLSISQMTYSASSYPTGGGRRMRFPRCLLSAMCLERGQWALPRCSHSNLRTAFKVRRAVTHFTDEVPGHKRHSQDLDPHLPN